MTNDEIRMKIAELKGWEFVPKTNIGQWGWKHNGKFIDYEIDAPNWPENIADAWELVEEWRANGEVDSIVYKTSDIPDFKMVDTVHLRHSYIYSEADTAPLAICLAYIAWKESQK